MSPAPIWNPQPHYVGDHVANGVHRQRNIGGKEARSRFSKIETNQHPWIIDIKIDGGRYS